MQTCGNTSLSLRFGSDFLVSAKCKAIFAVASFRNSSAQLFKLAWWSAAGAQPALHFGGGNYHKVSFDDVIVLIHQWYNFLANGHI